MLNVTRTSGPLFRETRRSILQTPLCERAGESTKKWFVWGPSIVTSCGGSGGFTRVNRRVAFVALVYSDPSVALYRYPSKVYTPGTEGNGVTWKSKRIPSEVAESRKSVLLGARDDGGGTEVKIAARIRTTAPRTASNRTLRASRATVPGSPSGASLAGSTRYRFHAPTATIGANREIFARTIHPYQVPRSASQVPTRTRLSTTPAPRTRATAYPAMSENPRKTSRAAGASSASRSQGRTRNRARRPPIHRETPRRWTASATGPTSPHGAAAAWVPPAPTRTPVIASPTATRTSTGRTPDSAILALREATHIVTRSAMPRPRRAAVVARNGEATRPPRSDDGRGISAFTQRAPAPTTSRNEPIHPQWRRARYPQANDGRPASPRSSPAGIQRNVARTAAPRAIASPANIRKRAATSNRETGRPPDVGPDPGSGPGSVPSGFWTANAKEPAVKWPSTAEVAVHVTVYTPGPIARSPIENVLGSEAERFTEPTSTRVPFESVTRIDAVPDWTASDRVTVTRVAGSCRIPFATGSDRTYCACAWAVPTPEARVRARRAMHARTRSLMFRAGPFELRRFPLPRRQSPMRPPRSRRRPRRARSQAARGAQRSVPEDRRTSGRSQAGTRRRTAARPGRDRRTRRWRSRSRRPRAARSTRPPRSGLHRTCTTPGGRTGGQRPSRRRPIPSSGSP